MPLLSKIDELEVDGERSSHRLGPAEVKTLNELDNFRQAFRSVRSSGLAQCDGGLSQSLNIVKETRSAGLRDHLSKRRAEPADIGAKGSRKPIHRMIAMLSRHGVMSSGSEPRTGGGHARRNETHLGSSRFERRCELGRRSTPTVPRSRYSTSTWS